MLVIGWFVVCLRVLRLVLSMEFRRMIWIRSVIPCTDFRSMRTGVGQCRSDSVYGSVGSRRWQAGEEAKTI